MKAIAYLNPGDTYRQLQLTDVPAPEVFPNQVLMQIRAAALNPCDYKFTLVGHQYNHYPAIPGVDIAGVIVKTGKNVGGWKEGEFVFTMNTPYNPGGFAEYRAVDAHLLSRIPPQLSFVQAAALPCAGMTAYQVVHRKLKLSGKETVLIMGVTGGVGLYAAQLSTLLGCRVIGVCSAKNVDLAHSFGCKQVIAYDQSNIFDEVMRLSASQGVDAVIDAVGPESATKALRMVKFNGQLACIAGFPDFSHLKFFDRGLSIHEIALGAAFVRGTSDDLADFVWMNNQLAKLVADGQLKVPINETIRLEQVIAKLAQLADRHVVGKIVVEL